VAAEAAGTRAQPHRAPVCPSPVARPALAPWGLVQAWAQVWAQVWVLLVAPWVQAWLEVEVEVGAAVLPWVWARA
jgi:hypothetical protein